MVQKERTQSSRSYMRLKPAKVKSREKQTLGIWVRLYGVSSHPRLRFSIWPILFHVESLVVRYDLHVPKKSAPQPSLPLEFSSRHYASAKIQKLFILFIVSLEKL